MRFDRCAQYALVGNQTLDLPFGAREYARLADACWIMCVIAVCVCIITQHNDLHSKYSLVKDASGLARSC